MHARTLAALFAATLVACAATPCPRPSPRQLVRASGLVQRGALWPAAYLVLQDRLGPPTRIADDRYSWAARLGDDCYLIEVAVRDGVVVHIEDSHRRAAARHGYQRCTAAAR